MRTPYANTMAAILSLYSIKAYSRLCSEGWTLSKDISYCQGGLGKVLKLDIRNWFALSFIGSSSGEAPGLSRSTCGDAIDRRSKTLTVTSTQNADHNTNQSVDCLAVLAPLRSPYDALRQVYEDHRTG